ncbi:MAG: HlyD family type I secretion periplasmic adaptor subunit [Minwuiales bacterium]|nr:HlyD family type I secretion periplasmic adaptor subunit [Minwuiales bacterium]
MALPDTTISPTPWLDDRRLDDGSAVAVRDNVPRNSKPAILIGMIVVLLGMGGFGTWAAVADLESAVIASGTVKVFSNRKKVQPLEGGVVSELMVRNGDTVNVGDVLVTLDKTRNEASYAIVRGNFDATSAAVVRLRAERDGLDEIAFPADLTARADDPAVAEILQGQQALFHARRESLDGQIVMVRERVGQLREEIRGLQAQVDAQAIQIDLIERELIGLRQLLEKGYTSKTRVLALEREAARLQGERGQQIAAIARARRLIGEADLEVIQLKNDFTEKIAAELREHENELYDLAERRNAARYNLDQMKIKATASGTVVGLDVHTVGGVVQPGAVLMEIVPADESLVVEARVRPMDVDDVKVGLAADVQFTAFPQRTTPKLIGDLVYVSADSMQDQKTGESYFLAHIAVSEREARRLGDRELQPGMPADVFINTGERTPFDYLTQPIKDGMSKAWREQ